MPGGRAGETPKSKKPLCQVTTLLPGHSFRFEKPGWCRFSIRRHHGDSSETFMSESSAVTEVDDMVHWRSSSTNTFDCLRIFTVQSFVSLWCLEQNGDDASFIGRKFGPELKLTQSTFYF